MSFSFGSPSSAPATSSLSSGFSFGANKPATPAFGLTGATQSTGLFGTPATSAPAFGATSSAFGTTAGFGQAPTNFGAATPGFGATSAAPSFGTGSTPAFGATSAAPAFGATTPAFGASGFGATSTAPAFGATSTAPSFGATSSFAATSAPSAFGTTAPSFGTGGLNFGAGSNTSTAGTGLTLGAPATTASTGLGGLGGFGFGSNTTGGLFGATTTASGGLFGTQLGSTTVSGAVTSTAAAPSLGLGGIAPAGGAAPGGDKAEAPKQTKLPNEILTTLDSFKQFVKKQKSLSSEIMRVSIKPLHKVSRDAEATVRATAAVAGEVSRCRAHCRRLRAAAAAALAAAEAHAASELDSTAPPAYVKELLSELEQQLVAFKRQMDVADKQMRASPKLLTDQELTLGIRRMHEAGVALAGRLQAVHAAVRDQRDQYLNLRKYVLKDHHADASEVLDMILNDTEGSRKKSKSDRLSGSQYGSAVLTDPRAALGSIQQLAGPTPFTYITGTLSPFPSMDSSGPSWLPSQPALNSSLNTSLSAPDNTFQLQKPPGKRGKQ